MHLKVSEALSLNTNKQNNDRGEKNVYDESQFRGGPAQTSKGSILLHCLNRAAVRSSWQSFKIHSIFSVSINPASIDCFDNLLSAHYLT